MTARRYVNIEIRGVVYPDADAAGDALGVTGTTIRAHIRAGTLDRVGLGRNGVEPMCVRIRGKNYDSPDAAAKALGVGVSQVYRRLAEGRPDDIGRPNKRGQYRAIPVQIGPVQFRSRAEAARKLGLGVDYVSRALCSGSPRMKERVVAAAMGYAKNALRAGRTDGAQT